MSRTRRRFVIAWAQSRLAMADARGNGDVMLRAFAVTVALMPLMATGLVVSIVPSAEADTVVRIRLRTAVRQLPLAAENRAGYVRDKFQLWIDANRDCQDTRAEVLVAESKIRTTGVCTIKTGKWFSYYDHRTFTRASQLDIDHLVPLAEAWDSGARRWNVETRTRYANDLGDARTLVAVSASANRSKGDRDPSEWMPTYGKCRYVRQWVAVKLRWSLKVNPAEKRTLVRRAGSCSNTVITVRKATIGTGTTSGGSGGGTSSSGLDPRFGTCTEANSHGYGPYYRSRDPEYSWYEDRDNDGVVCE